MMNTELKQILLQLRKQGRMRFFEGVSEEQILEFESLNHLVLPKKYHEWLQFSDGGECFLPGGVIFYGVAHKPLLNVNRDDRPDNRFLMIGKLSTGEPLLCKKDSEQICIYNHETGTIEEDEIYPDFFAFLKDLNELFGTGR